MNLRRFFSWNWMRTQSHPEKPSETKLSPDDLQAIRDLEAHPGWRVLLREVDMDMARIQWKGFIAPLDATEQMRLRTLFQIFGAPMTGVPGDVKRQGVSLPERITALSVQTKEDEDEEPRLL